MTNELAQVGIGAGAILLAALVVGVFRALLALRDNTKAIQGLDTTVKDFRISVDNSMTNLVGRVENLERWRIASDARSSAGANSGS